MNGMLRNLIVLGLVTCTASAAAAAGRTGVIEKKKVDGEKIEVFTDTVYGYTLSTPPHWDFKVQREKGDGEFNPFRLRIQDKDKQLPTQLYDSPSAVVNAHIHIFIFDSDLSPEAIRDSLASPTSKGDWQDPIFKNCELLRDSRYLNKGEVRWGVWKGSSFSVEQEYTAQVPSGAGFTSLAEKRLGEFYVFPFRSHIMVVYMVSEREYLQENRKVVEDLLGQIDPEKG